MTERQIKLVDEILKYINDHGYTGGDAKIIYAIQAVVDETK